MQSPVFWSSVFLEGAARSKRKFLSTNLCQEPDQCFRIEPIMGTSNLSKYWGEGNNIPTPRYLLLLWARRLKKRSSIGNVFLAKVVSERKNYPYIKKHAKQHSQHNNTGTTGGLSHAEVGSCSWRSIKWARKTWRSDGYWNANQTAEAGLQHHRSWSSGRFERRF